MPIGFAEEGKEYVIVRLGGNTAVKHHLSDMGFHVGGKITLVQKAQEGFIVGVKGARIALGRDLASKIFVE